MRQQSEYQVIQEYHFQCKQLKPTVFNTKSMFYHHHGDSDVLINNALIESDNNAVDWWCYVTTDVLSLITRILNYSSLRVKCRRLVHGNTWVNERLATSDDVSSLLCHHDGGRVKVAADDAGHDGSIDHA